ncbi:MAG: lysozyme [Gaiellaceae bacterium]|jgi:GH25 family lysozyme M1 (1,4-beta-N-acetylmuramidase)|nr:lysozyme [Gaiellaceae bacterium]
MAIVGSSGVARRARFACVSAVVVLAAALFSASSGAVSTTRAKGVDVSNWQGAINWTKVAGAGYRFAIAKATESTTYEDSTYLANRSGSEAAGLSFGAYHFARPYGSSLAAVTASAVSQADYFLGFATPQPGELPPVLDLEATGALSARLLNAWTLAWAQEVYARLGVHPLIYSSPAFWQQYLADSPAVAAAGTPLWIAHWTSASAPWVPAQNWNGLGWTFWQWTNCVSVPGIGGCVDGDRMNGTSPASIAIAPYPEGTPTVGTPPSIVGIPEEGMVLSAVSGVWDGGKPLAFTRQWRRCDAAGDNCVDIPGATRIAYRPTTDDVGHSIRVVVAAANGTATRKASTPATVAISPAGTAPTARPTNLRAPAILGLLQVGQKLTTTVGTWTGSPTKFSYRWKRCDANGSHCAPIANATHPAYLTTPDDLDSTIAVVVTATGTGGSATAQPVKTAAVAAAPLPPLSVALQTVVRGVAGNVGAIDGRATATWQPGAVPVGLTVNLDSVDQDPAIGGSGVALHVPDLPITGFRWPVELAYPTPAPAGTVLGYSTDEKVFRTVPVLGLPSLPIGQSLGSYVADDGTTHVLTRAPLELALFTGGGWGDPTYTSPTGPDLTQETPVRTVARLADRSLLVLTRLTAASQTRLTATITSPMGKPVSILPLGSVFGSPLPAGPALRTVKAERDQPETIRVRLRLNARYLVAGKYTLRITAVDPWGRTSVKRFRFAIS